MISQTALYDIIKNYSRTIRPPDETQYNELQKHVVSKVPNTPEGREFIENLRKYYNKKRFTFRVVGRGPRVKAALKDGRCRRCYDQDLPLHHAEYFSVYLNERKGIETTVTYAHGFYMGVINTFKYFYGESNAKR